MDYQKTDDNVNHPNHYMINRVGFEPIELTARIGSCLGQALQYIIRAPYKDNQVEDLEKAIFYLEKWLELHEGSVEILFPAAFAYGYVYANEYGKSHLYDLTKFVLKDLFSTCSNEITAEKVQAVIDRVQRKLSELNELATPPEC